ncbi:hypothetical protein GN244_ATG04227 [Phytophthora infestans]|uniref:Uncharacterized protein n=1 Tax=Phytophthora infestans TaxID=4787 RepID=A0A833WZF5_PHYIN|nr:hypothetical protein GN244_ATG04227 [Phytophthora infestans]KAF4147169.1 hypothetical protein GN958_ATG03579 [Phytophthora infestans]
MVTPMMETVKVGSYRGTSSDGAVDEARFSSGGGFHWSADAPRSGELEDISLDQKPVVAAQ